MNIGLQKSLHHLTGKVNINDIALQELTDYVNTYPYFAPAHFFLSYKQQQSNSTAAENQIAKTNLHFNNAYWLHYQLQEQPQFIEFVNKNKIEEEAFKPLINKVAQEEIIEQVKHQKEIEQEALATASVESKETESAINQNDTSTKHTTIPPVIEIPTIEHVQELMNNIAEEKPDIIHSQEINDETIAEQPSITSFALETTNESYNTDENTKEALHENFNKVIENAEPEKNEIAEEINPVTIANEMHLTPENEEEIDNTDNDELPEKEEAEDTATHSEIANMLEQQLEQFKQPVTTEDKLPIEVTPYHAIDYFASQGIKAENNGTTDKLTTQLKTFTEWLKQMKKLSLDNQEDLGTDPELENAIQGIAQNSNEAKEIVTETMAEVLEKQGKKDKAIQLYIKLSFLNPDKSAYFAAKIQQLKGI